jgi:signal-transduction protein with cAMP-binding, CBS, and nucleotidyltransferase domain
VDEASLSRKEQFLARLRIFAELSGEELADLALIAREYTFEEGAVIAYQRDLAEAMIIVYEGRLYASHVDEQGLVRDSYAYETGEYFEDVWLFKPGTHWGTVKGSAMGTC